MGDYGFYPSHEQKSLGPHPGQRLRSRPVRYVAGGLASPRPVIGNGVGRCFKELFAPQFRACLTSTVTEVALSPVTFLFENDTEGLDVQVKHSTAELCYCPLSTQGFVSFSGWPGT